MFTTYFSEKNQQYIIGSLRKKRAKIVKRRLKAKLFAFRMTLTDFFNFETRSGG